MSKQDIETLKKELKQELKDKSKAQALQSKFGGWIWLCVTIMVIIIDQWSKQWANFNLYFGVPHKVTAFLNYTLYYNSGASFSFLDSAGGWQVYALAAVSIVIAILVLIWLKRTPRTEKLMCIGLCLIEGGAVGNLIDRLSRGFVIDFLDFHIKGWHYAIFNVADAAVCIGVALVVISILFFRGKQEEAAA